MGNCYELFSGCFACRDNMVKNENSCYLPSHCNRAVWTSKADGCSGGDWNSLVPSYYEPACEMHDLCYATGLPQVHCDHLFYLNLYEINPTNFIHAEIMYAAVSGTDNSNNVDAGKANCNNPSCRVVIENKIQACPGQFGFFDDGGLNSASAQALCPDNYEICKSAEQAKSLGLTSTMCSSGSFLHSTNEFFATLQSSDGYWNCNVDGSGTNDIWGCSSNTNFNHLCQDTLTSAFSSGDYISGQGSWAFRDDGGHNEINDVISIAKWMKINIKKTNYYYWFFNIYFHPFCD
eukprot:130902_1